MSSYKSSLLHRIAANYIVGNDIKASIEGTKIQVETFNKLINVSKDLRESLHHNNDLDKAISLIEEKKKLTKQFQDLTGVKWYL